MRKKHRNKTQPIYNKIKNDLKLLNCMIFNSIKNDYSKQLENTVKNIKLDNNVFKNIKKITTYKKTDNMPNSIYNDNNLSERYSTDTQKANALAAHFENIHKLTHKSVSLMESIVNNIYESYDCETPVMQFNETNPANFKDTPNAHHHNTTQTHYEYFTSVSELSHIINTLNSKKTSGNDKTSNYLLKKMPRTFISLLVIMMNHIINIQYIPKVWKFGVITAICKPKKDNTQISSYRPITQLSAISKLLEKKMDLRIRTHCKANNLINQCQYGFQPKKSTEIAAAKLITDISQGLNSQKPTIAVLIDFQAAFDTIWHKALIYKMHSMNFDKNIICLVKSYISDRTFAVKINNKLSTIKQIVAGAPQGGILSAIFYLIYTNDFPQPSSTMTQIKRIMFADDTVIYTITKNIKQAKNDLNQYLQKIANYVKCWKLKLNKQKTELISIVGNCKDLSRSTRKQAQNIELQIENTTIKKCKTVKYLGIVLASNFKFIEHINYTLQKVNSAKAQLKSAFNNKYMNQNVKSLLYKQLIRPIMLYACSCWMQVSSNQIERLRRAERWFLRKITGLHRNKTTKKYHNSTRLYTETKINRFDQELIKNNLKFINKQNENEHINTLIINNENYINTSKYKPINYYHHLHSKELLIQENKLLIFNKGYRNPNQILYVTNQNNTSIQSIDI